jgi:hypothetical protein
LNPGGFSKPQLAHAAWMCSGSAQLPQNFMPSGLSNPHAGQLIAGILSESTR